MNYVDEEDEEGKIKLQLCAERLAEEGLKAIKAGDYNAAEVTIGGSLELRIALYGNYASECVNGYYLYGLLLLYKFREEDKKFASLFKARNNEGVNESILDKAWRLLITAREIVEMKDSEDVMEYLEILETMAEVSLEREDVIHSICCYEHAITRAKQLFGPPSLRLADLFFRLCFLHLLVLNIKMAISCWQNGISVCWDHLEQLKFDGTDLNSISKNMDESVSLERLFHDIKAFGDVAVVFQDSIFQSLNRFFPLLMRAISEIDNSKYTGRGMVLGVTDRGMKQLGRLSDLNEPATRTAILQYMPKEYKKHIVHSADVMMEEGLKALAAADYTEALASLYGCVELRLASYGEYALEVLDARVAFAIARAIKDQDFGNCGDVLKSGIDAVKSAQWRELMSIYCSPVVKTISKQTPTENAEILVALGEVFWTRGLCLNIYEFFLCSLFHYANATACLEPISIRRAEVYFRICYLFEKFGYTVGVAKFWKKGIYVCKARMRENGERLSLIQSNNGQVPYASYSSLHYEEKRLLEYIIEVMPWECSSSDPEDSEEDNPPTPNIIMVIHKLKLHQNCYYQKWLQLSPLGRRASISLSDHVGSDTTLKWSRFDYNQVSAFIELLQSGSSRIHESITNTKTSHRDDRIL